VPAQRVDGDDRDEHERRRNDEAIKSSHDESMPHVGHTGNIVAA
jgi:hypothetical protein